MLIFSQFNDLTKCFWAVLLIIGMVIFSSLSIRVYDHSDSNALATVSEDRSDSADKLVHRILNEKSNFISLTTYLFLNEQLSVFNSPIVLCFQSLKLFIRSIRFFQFSYFPLIAFPRSFPR